VLISDESNGGIAAFHSSSIIEYTVNLLSFVPCKQILHSCYAVRDVMK
jgi:hypothetical protein